MDYVFAFSNLISYLFSVVISFHVDKTKEFRKAFIQLHTLLVVSLGLLTVMLEFSSPYYHFFIYSVLFLLILIALFSIFNLSIEYACETTFPVDETVSSGIIFSTINFFGGLVAKACEYLMTHDTTNRYASHFLMFAFSLIGYFIVFFLNGKFLTRKLGKKSAQFK